MRKFNTLISAVVIACALMPWNAPAIDRSDFIELPGANSFSANYIEGLLVKSLIEVTQGRIQQALDTLDQLLKTAPNFKLAYLVRGDLLMAKARALQSFGNSSASSPETIEDFREEAQSRIERYLSQKAGTYLPEPLWQLDTSQKHAILVDTEKSRLYLYRNENNQPQYVADYYVTIGKNGSEKSTEGDKRTPLGVYLAGGKLSKKLPDFYGNAAYPLSYPNEWDRKQGKKGHGIWIHGTPSNTYSRPPRASDGCVVVSNPDLKSLSSVLQSGKTPVVIARNIQWLEKGQTSTAKTELALALENWRSDWESQDTDKYLDHYSPQFFSQTADFANWSKEKRRIQANKPHVEIKLSNISMMRYPNNQYEMAIVSFDQDFKSNNLDSQIRKRQYWIFENNRWKILYEGAA